MSIWNIFGVGSRTITPTQLGGWNFNLGNAANKPVTPDSALQLATAWACVRLKSRTVGTLPIAVYEKLADGTRKARSDHWLYDIVHDSPNADQTASEFWMGMVACIDLWGNAYAQKDVASNGRVISLTPLRAEWMWVYRDMTGARRYRYSDPNRAVQDMGEDQVFHLRGFTAGGDMGLSAISYGRQTLGAAIAADEVAGKTFANGLQLAGFIEMATGTKVDGDQRKQIVELFQKFAGSNQAGKVMPLDPGMKFTALGMMPDDAQLLETRGFHVEEICRWFDVLPVLIGHAAAGQTMWGCLPADALVFTNCGPRPIVDVRPGEMVWARVDGRMVLRRVLRSGQTGTKPTLTVRTRDRSLSATANHEFLARRKFPAPRGGLGGYRAVEWRNVWLRADELTTDDYLILAHDMPESGGDVAPNGRHVTEAFMEFCGLYIAEGSMNSRAVTIARHDEAPYMDVYRASMTASFCKANGEPIVIREQVRSTAFSSVCAVRELKGLGFSGVAHTKRVPAWVFQLSKPLILAFLRGYLDGDGTVNKRGWITWTSVNPDLLEDVRHLCMQVGIPCGEACAYPIKLKFNGDERSDGGVVWQAWSFSVEHNRRIGTHDPRYLERLAAAPLPSRLSRFSPDYVGRGAGGARPGVDFDIKGAVLGRVIGVDGLNDPVPVYDIEVEEAHNFVANGIVVHNSGVEQIMLGWLTLNLQPMLTSIEQAIEKQLLPAGMRKNIYAEFNFEGLLRADSAGRASLYSTMAQNGLMVRDEIRAKENLPPIPGGQTATVQSNLIDLAKLGETPPTDTPPGFGIPKPSQPPATPKPAIPGE